MKLIWFGFIAIFCTLASASPPQSAIEMLIKSRAFSGAPAWLLIGEVASSEREAALKAGERLKNGIYATPLRTDYFEKLTPGKMAVIYGSFASKEEAKKRAIELAARGIKTDVKFSGKLRDVRGQPTVLVHLFGELDESLTAPMPIEVSDENDESLPSVRTFSDRQRWYQVWVPVPANKTGQLRVTADMTHAPKVPDRPECTGWFNKGGEAVRYPKEGTKSDYDIEVVWSPIPDCCDN